MANEISKQTLSVFEQIRQTDKNGNEFWAARQLAKVLDYTDFRNFLSVIEKAKDACKNSGQKVEHHLVEFNEEINHGKGAVKVYQSYKLSRYACYLIVQNADPSKEIVALGQTYFAVQTRLQEIHQMDEYNRLSTENEKRIFLRNELAKHNTQLAAAAKDAGVIEPIDYAIFQNHGYMGLYGGLAANLFRATQTEEKLRRENLKGKQKANITHFEVGKKVRQTIEEIGGTMPENLPKEDSIKKLETTTKAKLNK